jgi:hypothetical protein
VSNFISTLPYYPAEFVLGNWSTLSLTHVLFFLPELVMISKRGHWFQNDFCSHLATLNQAMYAKFTSIFSQFPNRDCFIFPDKSLIGKAEVVVVTDNDMVKEANAGCPGCHHEAFGKFLISVTGGY